MNTIELIKDAALFGGTVPNERIEEVRSLLDKMEKQLTLTSVGVPFYCGGHNGSDRCKVQCHGCENDEIVN